MKKLIKGQSFRFDAHDSGSGQAIDSTRDIHMHKVMNKDRYNGAEVLIPANPNKNIEIRRAVGKSKDVKNRILAEIKNAFKKTG